MAEDRGDEKRETSIQRRRTRRAPGEILAEKNGQSTAERARHGQSRAQNSQATANKPEHAKTRHCHNHPITQSSFHQRRTRTKRDPVHEQVRKGLENVEEGINDPAAEKEGAVF